MVTVPDFEAHFTDPAFLADPYPLLQEMRETAPIYWSDSIGGWVLTRYEDIIVSFKDTERFSNENRLSQASAHLPPETRTKLAPFENHFAAKSLLHSDPPDHTRMRGLVTRELNPKVVEQMKPSIQATVDALIDAAIAKGSMDVVNDLAAPLPIGVIAQILGVPAEYRPKFRGWADDLLTFQGVNKPSAEDLFRAQRAIQELKPYLLELLAERRRQPQDDLISKLAAAEAETGQISENELVSTCITLCVAGQETTISMIANAIYLFLSHPGQLERVTREPQTLATALEETLRFESPVSRQPRRMKADIEIGGKLFQKGQMVFQMVNAANRDPAIFENPETFDVRRRPNRHIAFGYGIHFCVGAVLARAESLIAVGTLLRRLSKLRLIEQTPAWELDKRNSRVLHTLPIGFTERNL
jgi:pimeloyl-[acyl-carrier protein] synthase